MKYSKFILVIIFCYASISWAQETATDSITVNISDSLEAERLQFENKIKAIEDSIANLEKELRSKESDYRLVKTSQLTELIRAALKIPEYESILKEYDDYVKEAEKERQNFESRINIYREKEKIYMKQIELHNNRIKKLERKYKSLKAKNKLNKYLFSSVGLVGGIIVGTLISR